jgi:hypothetical protein
VPDPDDIATLRARAQAMRGTSPPATYSEIAAALGLSRSTAYRYANPSALEAARQAQARRRADPDRKPAMQAYEHERDAAHRCARCGGRAARKQTYDPVCRATLKYQAAAEHVLDLVYRYVPPTDTALYEADPELKRIRLGLLLRQMRATGVLQPGAKGVPHLDNEDLVDQVVAAKPTDLSRLTSSERALVVMAAGAHLAAQERAEA